MNKLNNLIKYNKFGDIYDYTLFKLSGSRGEDLRSYLDYLNSSGWQAYSVDFMEINSYRFGGFFRDLKNITPSELNNFLIYFGATEQFIQDKIFINKILYFIQLFDSEFFLSSVMYYVNIAELYFILSSKIVSHIFLFNLIKSFNSKFDLVISNHKKIVHFLNQKKGNVLVDEVEINSMRSLYKSIYSTVPETQFQIEWSDFSLNDFIYRLTMYLIDSLYKALFLENKIKLKKQEVNSQITYKLKDDSLNLNSQNTLVYSSFNFLFNPDFFVFFESSLYLREFLINFINKIKNQVFTNKYLFIFSEMSSLSKIVGSFNLFLQKEHNENSFLKVSFFNSFFILRRFLISFLIDDYSIFEEKIKSVVFYFKNYFRYFFSYYVYSKVITSFLGNELFNPVLSLYKYSFFGFGIFSPSTGSDYFFKQGLFSLQNFTTVFDKRNLILPVDDLIDNFAIQHYKFSHNYILNMFSSFKFKFDFKFLIFMQIRHINIFSNINLKWLTSKINFYFTDRTISYYLYRKTSENSPVSFFLFQGIKDIFFSAFSKLYKITFNLNYTMRFITYNVLNNNFFKYTPNSIRIYSTIDNFFFLVSEDTLFEGYDFFADDNLQEEAEVLLLNQDDGEDKDFSFINYWEGNEAEDNILYNSTEDLISLGYYITQINVIKYGLVEDKKSYTWADFNKKVEEKPMTFYNSALLGNKKMDAVHFYIEIYMQLLYDLQFYFPNYLPSDKLVQDNYADGMSIQNQLVDLDIQPGSEYNYKSVISNIFVNVQKSVIRSTGQTMYFYTGKNLALLCDMTLWADLFHYTLNPVFSEEKISKIIINDDINIRYNTSIGLNDLLAFYENYIKELDSKSVLDLFSLVFFDFNLGSTHREGAFKNYNKVFNNYKTLDKTYHYAFLEDLASTNIYNNKFIINYEKLADILLDLYTVEFSSKKSQFLATWFSFSSLWGNISLKDIQNKLPEDKNKPYVYELSKYVAELSFFNSISFSTFNKSTTIFDTFNLSGYFKLLYYSVRNTVQNTYNFYYVRNKYKFSVFLNFFFPVIVDASHWFLDHLESIDNDSAFNVAMRYQSTFDEVLTNALISNKNSRKLFYEITDSFSIFRDNKFSVDMNYSRAEALYSNLYFDFSNSYSDSLDDYHNNSDNKMMDMLDNSRMYELDQIKEYGFTGNLRHYKKFDNAEFNDIHTVDTYFYEDLIDRKLGESTKDYSLRLDNLKMQVDSFFSSFSSFINKHEGVTYLNFDKNVSVKNSINSVLNKAYNKSTLYNYKNYFYFIFFYINTLKYNFNNYIYMDTSFNVKTFRFLIKLLFAVFLTYFIKKNINVRYVSFFLYILPTYIFYLFLYKFKSSLVNEKFQKSSISVLINNIIENKSSSFLLDLFYFLRNSLFSFFLNFLHSLYNFASRSAFFNRYSSLLSHLFRYNYFFEFAKFVNVENLNVVVKASVNKMFVLNNFSSLRSFTSLNLSYMRDGNSFFTQLSNSSFIDWLKQGSLNQDSCSNLTLSKNFLNNTGYSFMYKDIVENLFDRQQKSYFVVNSVNNTFLLNKNNFFNRYNYDQTIISNSNIMEISDIFSNQNYKNEEFEEEEIESNVADEFTEEFVVGDGSSLENNPINNMEFTTERSDDENFMLFDKDFNQLLDTDENYKYLNNQHYFEDDDFVSKKVAYPRSYRFLNSLGFLLNRNMEYIRLLSTHLFMKFSDKVVLDDLFKFNRLKNPRMRFKEYFRNNSDSIFSELYNVNINKGLINQQYQRNFYDDLDYYTEFISGAHEFGVNEQGSLSKRGFRKPDFLQQAYFNNDFLNKNLQQITSISLYNFTLMEKRKMDQFKLKLLLNEFSGFDSKSINFFKILNYYFWLNLINDIFFKIVKFFYKDFFIYKVNVYKLNSKLSSRFLVYLYSKILKYVSNQINKYLIFKNTAHIEQVSVSSNNKFDSFYNVVSFNITNNKFVGPFVIDNFKMKLHNVFVLKYIFNSELSLNAYFILQDYLDWLLSIFGVIDSKILWYKLLNFHKKIKVYENYLFNNIYKIFQIYSKYGVNETMFYLTSNMMHNDFTSLSDINLAYKLFQLLYQILFFLLVTLFISFLFFDFNLDYYANLISTWWLYKGQIEEIVMSDDDEESSMDLGYTYYANHKRGDERLVWDIHHDIYHDVWGIF